MKERVRQALSFCSPEFTALAVVARAACPAMRIQRGSFEKLIAEAETLGLVEHKREGSAKFIRLSGVDTSRPTG